GRGADQSPVVAARDHDEREQADDEPRGLAQGDGGAGAPHAEGRERHHAHDDERAGGREQRPVDVLEEAAVDAQHQPRTSIAATRSKKIAFRIFRAIGAATSPPLPPCSTSTTTTTSGFFTGANAANQAWSWPSVAFDFPMICAVPVLPAMSSPGTRNQAVLLALELDPGRRAEAEGARVAHERHAADLQARLVEEDVARLHDRALEVDRAVAALLPVFERRGAQMELAGALGPVGG